MPCCPELTAILRAHIEREKLAPGDLLFQGEKGGVLAGSVSRRAGDRARERALTDDEYASPVAARVYDLRHTCLSEWLNVPVSLAKVAAWAGNSVAVLPEIYALCIDGQDADFKKRIDAARQPGCGPSGSGTAQAQSADWRRSQPDMVAIIPIVWSAAAQPV